MAEITAALLDDLTTSYSALFRQGLQSEPKQTADKIATTVQSRSESNTYAWLNQVPGMREWIGERSVKQLSKEAYKIENRTFEDTIEVQRKQISDDQYGVYAPLFMELGQRVTEHKAELVWELVANGHEEKCYDGKPFFASNHPVIDAKGKTKDVSNIIAGVGPAWYLLYTMRAVKPFILQEREGPELVEHTDPRLSDRVFNRDVYTYGVRLRRAVGFSFWQYALKSTAVLDLVNLRAARQTMMNLRGNHGRLLSIMPNIIAVPPDLMGDAEDLFARQYEVGGGSNPLYKALEVIVEPRLAA